MLVTMVSTLALLALVSFCRCIPLYGYTAPTAKLDFQADMALLMENDSFSAERHKFLTLVDMLEVAEDKVRVGAWYFDNNETKTIVDLTGNVSYFKQMVNHSTRGLVTAKTYDKWDVAFTQMIDVFKLTGRRGIPKLIYAPYLAVDDVLLAIPTRNYSVEAEKAGLQLHTSFRIYRGWLHAYEVPYLEQYYPTVRQFAFDIDDLANLLCGQQNGTCTFDTSGDCVRYGEGSLIPVDPLECSKFLNLTALKKSCNKTTCEAFCDDRLQWPSMNEACAGKCGKITVQRNRTSSNLPQSEMKMVSRCPTGRVEEKKVECDCTTTTTSSTTEKPTSSKPLSTTSVQRSTTESSKPFPWWATLMIVAAVAITLLIIILAVVIPRRRRMQRKSAPASEKTSVRGTSLKGKVEVKGGKGIGVAVGGEKGAVKREENMGVSLIDVTVKKTVKAKGSSMKTSIKDSSVKGSSTKGSSIKDTSVKGSSVKGSSIKGSSIKTSIKGEAEVSEKGSKKSSRAMPEVSKGPKIAAHPKKA